MPRTWSDRSLKLIPVACEHIYGSHNVIAQGRGGGIGDGSVEEGGIDYFGLAVFLLILSFVIFLFAKDAWETRKESKRLSEAKKALERFKSSARVEGNRLVLPEFCTVEIGTIVYRISRRSLGVFEVDNGRLVSSGVLNLSDICNEPFYLYFDNAGYAATVAPGFVIKDGTYKDVVGICLNQDAIPRRSLELRAEKLPHAAAFARVELTKDGFRGEVRLSGAWGEAKGPLGLGTRRASLKICYEVRGWSECVKIAESTDNDPNVTGEYSWVLSRNPTILFQNVHLMQRSASELYQELLEAIKINLRIYAGTRLVESAVSPIGGLVKKIMAGYRPEHVEASLDLFSPFKIFVHKEEKI